MRTASALASILILSACGPSDARDATNTTRSFASGSVEEAVSTNVTAPTTSTAIAAGPRCDDGKRYCREMTTCEDAQFHLNQCGLKRLDGDHDGTACDMRCQ